MSKGRALQKIWPAAKPVLTLLLCGWILLQADWREIGRALARAEPVPIALVAGGMVLNIVVSARKWQLLLKMHGVGRRLMPLTREYLIAAFFNNFLPTNIGGDGFRMYAVYRRTRSKRVAVMPIFTERLFGLLLLLLLGSLGALVSFFLGGDDLALWGIGLGAAGSGVLLTLLALPHLRPVQSFLRHRSRLPRTISVPLQGLGVYTRRLPAFVHFLFISLLFCVIMVGNRMVLLQAVGDSVSFFTMAFVVMISTVAATLPLSINGIGLLDVSFVYLLSRTGVDYEAALITMLLYRALSLGISLLGGVLHQFNRMPSGAEGEEELRGLQNTMFQGSASMTETKHAPLGK